MTKFHDQPGGGSDKGLTLDVYRGHDKVETIALGPGTTFTVGREGQVDVKNRHETVSRLHAEISVEGPHVFVTDSGSTHGTFLDSKRIAAHDPQPFDKGSKLRFGKSGRTYRIASGKSSGFTAPQPQGGGEEPLNRARLEELAKALKFLLRPGDRRSYEMRPDGYVQLSAVIESGAFTNYNTTEQEIVHMAETVACHIYELVELSGVRFIRLRMEGGDVVGPLVEVANADGLPMLIHSMMFKDWNIVRSTGLQAKLRSPVVFTDHVPVKGEACHGCLGAPQIFVSMDIERMQAKGLKLYVDGNNNIVCAGGANGQIPISFFQGCHNAKNKEDLLGIEDIERVRKAEEEEEAKLEAQQARATEETDRGLVKGANVRYKLTGELATIQSVHMDDVPPYYTIVFSGGREKQTTAERLDVLTEEEARNFSPVLSPRSQKKKRKQEEEEKQAAQVDYFGLDEITVKGPGRKKKRINL